VDDADGLSRPLLGFSFSLTPASTTMMRSTLLAAGAGCALLLLQLQLLLHASPAGASHRSSPTPRYSRRGGRATNKKDKRGFGAAASSFLPTSQVRKQLDQEWINVVQKDRFKTESSSACLDIGLPSATLSSPGAMLLSILIPRGGGAAAKSAKASKAKSANASSSSLVAKQIYGVVAMAAIENFVGVALKAGGVSFPPMLGGCIFLFFGLLLLEAVAGAGVANAAYEGLVPGAALCAKWVSVFFVPGLVLLPLSPPIGNGVEVRTENKRYEGMT